jgi:hypothetical protein
MGLEIVTSRRLNVMQNAAFAAHFNPVFRYSYIDLGREYYRSN